MQESRTWTRGWRGATLIVVGVFIGATLITPAVAHVTTSVTHLFKHTDKRYYKKTTADTRFVRLDPNATLPLGKTETGVYSATANASGFSAATLGFRPKLPADIPNANAHYMTGGATDSNCPGPGQAAPGHLCVYESAAVTSSFLGFFRVESNSGTTIDDTGTILFWGTSGSQSRVWGLWAVTAPTTLSAVTSKPSRSGEPTSPLH